jgi:hypothetical protein
LTARRYSGGSWATPTTAVAADGSSLMEPLLALDRFGAASLVDESNANGAGSIRATRYTPLYARGRLGCVDCPRACGAIHSKRAEIARLNRDDFPS